MFRARFLLVALLGSACSGQSASAPAALSCPASLNTRPGGAAWSPSVDPHNPVSASFAVVIDPTNPALASTWLQPHPEPLTISSSGSGQSGLQLSGGVKRFAAQPQRLLLELYLSNDGATGVSGAQVTVADIKGSAAFYDFTTSPWASATTNYTLAIGGIAPEGVSARIRIGFDVGAGNAPISFTLQLAGTTTTRVSTSSSPIRVSAAGSEAWAVSSDAGQVAVIDTASDKRVAQVAVPGQPQSLAVTPDDQLVLVATSACNQLTVIDRATRAVTQVFGEADGIGRDARNVVLSPDGTRAYVSAYVDNVVTVLGRAGSAFQVLGTVALDRRPLGMSVTPDGKTVLVAHFMPRGVIRDNESWLSVIDAATMTKAGEIVLRDDADVTEAACLQLIPGFNQYSATDLSFEGVPTQLAGVFLDPGGSVGWVPGLRIGPFPILEGDLAGTGFDFAVKGANSPGSLFPFDTRDVRNARIPWLSSLPDITDRPANFLQCGTFMEELEAVMAFPVSGAADEQQSPGTVLPSVSTPLSETGVPRFVGFSRGGRRALVLSYAADEFMVVDAATHSPTSQRYLLLSGSNPIGLAVTPNGAKGYVAYENSLFASVLDLSALATPQQLKPSLVPYRLGYNGIMAGQTAGIVTFGVLTRQLDGVPATPPVTETAQVALVEKDAMDPVMRRGKVLFTSSSPVKYPTLSGHREASCSSCHPNGGNDGSVWPTMEGERRTLGLWGGVAGRGWLHASATHQDITTFATIIVKERLGGSGLSPADEDALSSYAARGIPAIQRPATDPQLVAAGQAIFQARCAGCHQGDHYTSGAPDPQSPYGGGLAAGPVLLNVNSATDWAGAVFGVPYANLFPPTPKEIFTLVRGDRALGSGDPLQQILMFTQRPDRARGQLKAPSLRNVWENVLFFHDGRAATLTDAVTDIAARTGAPLSASDTAAVVEFLKTL